MIPKASWAETRLSVDQRFSDCNVRPRTWDQQVRGSRGLWAWSPRFHLVSSGLPVLITLQGLRVLAIVQTCPVLPDFVPCHHGGCHRGVSLPLDRTDPPRYQLTPTPPKDLGVGPPENTVCPPCPSAGLPCAELRLSLRVIPLLECTFLECPKGVLLLLSLAAEGPGTKHARPASRCRF